MLRRLLHRLPRTCLCCHSLHRETGPLCAACATALPRNQNPCSRCAEPQAMAGQLCARCQKKPPPFQQVIAPWIYEDAVARLIQRFKFSGELAAADALWPALAEAMSPLDIAALVPVPVHDHRHHERGFNQALWLADRLARPGRLPVLEALHKHRNTADQVGLTRSQRQKNLRHAFRLSRPTVPECVALVDDVVSSTATASQCSRLLKQAGARQVYVLALARTPREN